MLPVPVYKLIPRRIIAGMGCRRDTRADEVQQLFAEQLAENNLLPEAVRAIGSITLKAQEPALLALAARYQVPFTVFSAEELAPVAAQFLESEFVKNHGCRECIPAGRLADEQRLSDRANL